MPKLRLPRQTELVGLSLDLIPISDCTLYPQYTIGFHAWLLEQIRQTAPELSALLHDDQEEKSFTISPLDGNILSTGRSLRLQGNKTYQWQITAFSKSLVDWIRQWLKHPPGLIEIRDAPLEIKHIKLSLPPTTYGNLAQILLPENPTLPLTFHSPTGFRRRGDHLPLPWPPNVFHSYLRRWNLFSGHPVEPDSFLEWIDQSVIILRHELRSAKVLAGKKGSVTGFMGRVEFGITPRARGDREFVKLFLTLGRLAPYCGTGHKTTFGLGQTEAGWHSETGAEPQITAQDLQAQRVAELTERFRLARKRTGGDRAQRVAETWATVLVRRESGESLQVIAEDLGMPYQTVKTYVKLARKSLREIDSAT